MYKLDPRDVATLYLARRRFTKGWQYERAGQYRIWRKPGSDGFVCLNTKEHALVIALADGREIKLQTDGAAWRVADVLALAATYQLVEQH